jgi:hypothetical protein
VGERQIPKAGETWRAISGRAREVTFVRDEDLQDDGRWAFVYYTRPSPAADPHAVVSLKQWWEWVDKEQAFRTSKTWRAA